MTYDKELIALLDHIASSLFVIATVQASKHLYVNEREYLDKILQESAEHLDKILGAK